MVLFVQLNTVVDVVVVELNGGRRNFWRRCRQSKILEHETYEKVHLKHENIHSERMHRHDNPARSIVMVRSWSRSAGAMSQHAMAEFFAVGNWECRISRNVSHRKSVCQYIRQMCSKPSSIFLEPAMTPPMQRIKNQACSLFCTTKSRWKVPSRLPHTP